MASRYGGKRRRFDGLDVTGELEVTGDAGFAGTTTFNGPVNLSTVDFDSVAVEDGTAVAPSLAFENETTLGLYRQGAGDIGVTGNLELGDKNITTTGTISGAINLSGNLNMSNNDITNVNELSGFTMTGPIAGNSENIQGVGILGSSSLATGNIIGTTITSTVGINGTLNTAAQPNVTSVGTLGSLTVTGAANAATLGGELSTAAQPNVTSTGALTVPSLTSTADITANGNIVGDTLTDISSVRDITASGTVSATTLSGALSAGPQNGIDSVGTLDDLAVTGNVTAGSLTGGLTTAAQPNVTSLGPQASALDMNSQNILNANVVQASAYTGQLSGLQPFIFSVGPQGADIVFDTGFGPTLRDGTVVKAAIHFNGDQDTGLIRTAPDTASFITNGVSKATFTPTNVTVDSTVASTDSTSGSLVTAGGVGVGGDINASGTVSGASLTGELTTAAQPNVTSTGALTVPSLTSTADITANGNIVGDTLTDISSVRDITASGTVSATTLSGALSAGPQNGINSVGTLDDLAVTGNVTAGSLTGGLTTAAQPNVTSTGALTVPSLTSTADITANGNIVGDTLTDISSVRDITASGTVSGATLTGQLSAANQPNVTGLGAQAFDLNMSGNDINNVNTISALTHAGGDVNVIQSVTAGTSLNGQDLFVSTGSAANPSMSFTGDTNTGIFSSAPDVLAFTANGTVSAIVTDVALTATASTASTSSTTGSLVATGGLGVGGDVNVAGNLFASNVPTKIASGTGVVVTQASQLNLENLLTAGKRYRLEMSCRMTAAGQPEIILYENTTAVTAYDRTGYYWETSIVSTNDASQTSIRPFATDLQSSSRQNQCTLEWQLSTTTTDVDFYRYSTEMRTDAPNTRIGRGFYTKDTTVAVDGLHISMATGTASMNLDYVLWEY